MPPTPRQWARSWAQRLKRVFNIDIEVCGRCGGSVKVIACIEDQGIIDQILDHLRRKEQDTPTRPLLVPPSRTPPETSPVFPGKQPRLCFLYLKPRAVNWWKPKWILDAVDALLDRIDANGSKADLNMDLCARLPVHVVTRGIGMEETNALQFREHLLRSTVGGRHVTQEERMASATEVSKMLREVITQRRKHPQDDVISGLITNDLKLEDGSTRKLDDEEIFSYCRLIMLAGGGTTWRQLGITIHALLTNYKFWEACRDSRKMIGPAVEEAARWMPTDPVFERVVTADVELEGMTIPAASRVGMCFGSANRDPNRWDNPDTFDIFREFQSHLGFGMGPHRCLGMDVAKQEMITALNALMDRYPNMKLDSSTATPELLGGVEQRGMSAVPVILK